VDPVSNACEGLFDLSGGRFLIAYSGGMDSTVLLHGLTEAARRRDALDRVLAVHVDHGLSQDSALWAERCRETAVALGIAFEVHKLTIPPGGNLEARARTARYRIFDGLLDAGDHLLLAHHAGDQTESLLLHLFQGRGLYGMPASRPLGAGRLRRPFLDLPRDTLAGYARTHSLHWIEDPSNADLTLDRNFLRHSLLPLLQTRFEGLPGRLSHVAESVADTGLALDELADLERHPLPLEVLDGLSSPARIAVLRRWLTRHGINASVTTTALLEFLRQLDSGNDRLPRLDLATGSLVRYRRALHMASPSPALERSYALSIPDRLTLPHGELLIDWATEDSEYGAEGFFTVWLEPPVSITFLAELEPPAEILHGGHRRSVRTLMREAGVPPWLREALPLVSDRLGIAVVCGVAGRDPGPRGEGKTSSVRPARVRWTGEVR
jgi:tRNA(Ile)-lysidine synthase